ncbi:MAG: hypothetical protein K8T90_18565 [Planctomycetes bacterium]|nr:hypothetical protein [Planctomycetota bacterium]
MMVADDADEGRPCDRQAPAYLPARPVDFAQAARLIAEERLQGELVCRACALRLIEELVLASVEFAHDAGRRAVRRAIEEQTRWPN